MKKKPVDILVLNFRRLKYLKELVKQIKVRTEYPHRVIVIDNSSTRATKKSIAGLIKKGYIDKAVYIKENLLVPQAFEKGFELVKSEYFVVTVDDTIPPYTFPCWLSYLVYLMETYPEYGAISINRERRSSFPNYSKEKIDISSSSKDSITDVIAAEEFFRIQRSRDMRTIGFGDTQVDIYDFTRKMKEHLNKKVGRTLIGASVPHWRDERKGYPKNLRKFHLKSKSHKHVDKFVKEPSIN